MNLVFTLKLGIRAEKASSISSGVQRLDGESPPLTSWPIFRSNLSPRRKFCKILVSLNSDQGIKNFKPMSLPRRIIEVPCKVGNPVSNQFQDGESAFHLSSRIIPIALIRCHLYPEFRDLDGKSQSRDNTDPFFTPL